MYMSIFLFHCYVSLCVVNKDCASSPESSSAQFEDQGLWFKLHVFGTWHGRWHCRCV